MIYNILKLIKRIGDMLFCLAFILLFSPLIIVIYFLIFWEDKKDPIFKQNRIGYKGEIFKMYKFRTMKFRSEKKGTGYYCYEGDKRLTNIGKILRKYSLDEIPQLFNILDGKMSLVGPRPPIYDELDFEDIDEVNKEILLLRKKVKPGITGYAQVMVRNDCDWNYKLKLDSVYLKTNPIKRIFLDMKIIILTLKEMIFSSGEFDKK